MVGKRVLHVIDAVRNVPVDLVMVLHSGFVMGVFRAIVLRVFKESCSTVLL